MTKIGIIGGGISGLSTALFLRARGHVNITLLEGSNRLGGWISSERLPGGALVEHGTRSLSFRSRHIESILEMMKLLPGMKSRMMGIVKSSSVNKNRYIMYKGQVTKLPAGPISALTHPLTRQIPLAIMRDLLWPPQRPTPSGTDLSVFDLFQRFDPTTAEYLIGSFIHGVYAGDIRKWSAEMAFREPFRWVSTYGSFTRGTIMLWPRGFKTDAANVEATENLAWLNKHSLFSFRDGMSEFVQQISEMLAEKDSGVEVVMNAPCKSIEQRSSGIDCIVNGRHYTFDHVISTVPSFRLGKMLPDSLKLPHVRYESLHAVHFIYTSSPTQLPFPATFGILVPKCESDLVTGIIMDSHVFPERQPVGTQVLTVMLTQKAFTLHGPDGLADFARSVVQKHYSKTMNQAEVIVHSNPAAIPQFDVGHKAVVERFRSEVDAHFGNGRLRVAGAWTEGIGVPDCIMAAHNYAKTFATNNQ